MKKFVIVGGGTAGSMIANKLAKGLTKEISENSVSITMISEKDTHTYQPGFLYIPFHLKQPDELVRPIKKIVDSKVNIVLDSATKIDEANQTVLVKSGAAYSYDYLIIATGSHPKIDEVPGLKEAGYIFYDMENALKLRDEMDKFAGGKVVVAVGLPHKCPVAPLEFTMMFEDWCRQRGIRDKTEITYAYPLNGPYGTASVAELAEKEFNARDVKIQTFFMMDHVDPIKKEIISMDGTALPFDLLVAIPPHKGSDLSLSSGYGDDGGWLPVNRHKLNLENKENIFVIGDATNLPISKAGSTAHFESEILAENLIDKVRGLPGGRHYNGKVFCFIETGLNKATYITFDYDNPPKPVTPSKMVHYAKAGYNNIHWVNVKGIM